MALQATNALVAFSIMALADAVLVFATEAAVFTTADMTKFQTRASLGFDFGSMTCQRCAVRYLDVQLCILRLVTFYRSTRSSVVSDDS